MKLVFLIIAIVLFLLAAFGVAFGSVAVLPLALASFAASFLPLNV